MPRTKHHKKNMSDSEWRKRKNKKRFYGRKEKKLALIERMMEFIQRKG